ncbi:cobalamin-independent methionine synthase II family protein [Liquorilactobacillus mali]|uniref:cobalamin-independent methionine synthase II family protein n=1 Tax=Liquorilactobacillus mali TaxID=1618 RepID=UPI002350D996|nr:cobalamin-independent methionine synthase II family protein [Liquorilactobacillus mali]MDC7953016.1 cobalamin-independent methionine synthase II family protein [Liquorilactobacillus mali]MDV7757905.1 5-methyltetrahydropteroyltriglutamate--homocysteine methyltransferase [Liquorilactobacillus mali]
MTVDKFQLVGSLLRTPELLEYKNEIEHRDDIKYPFYNDLPGYKETESKAISKIIQSQIEHNLSVITDGEYSKSMWHLDFLWGFKGIERYIADHGYTFKDHDGGTFETRKDIGIKITGPLSGKNHHFVDIFKEIKKQAQGRTVKTTVWGAAHAVTELTVFDGLFGEDQVYKTKDELKEGVIKAYKEFLDDYKAAGGEIVQFDDCLWELFADDNESSFFADGTKGLEDLADEFVAINNAVVDYGHELGLKVWTHNCRGNYESRHAAGGSYKAIAEKFLRDQHYDRFFLEWDDDRAGDLSALEVLRNKPNVEVVLGLLSSKTNTLDDEKRVYRLLDKASQIIPKDRLFISHQCGFASCDSGNELTISQQWAKITQGQEIAKNFWSTVATN